MIKSLGYKASKFAFPLKAGLFCLGIWLIINSQQTKADEFSSEKTDSVNFSFYVNEAPCAKSAGYLKRNSSEANHPSLYELRNGSPRLAYSAEADASAAKAGHPCGKTAGYSAKENKDEWLGSDKLAHFTISLFLSAISYKMYHDNYYNDKNPSILFSGGFVFTLGLGKEFYDKRRPNGRFSYKDLIADAAGISIGLILATNH